MTCATAVWMFGVFKMYEKLYNKQESTEETTSN